MCVDVCVCVWMCVFLCPHKHPLEAIIDMEKNLHSS